MSTKRGESGNRKKPPKHQNTTAWNWKRDKSDSKAKLIQSLTIINCCQRCTEVIEWKIKYGKYKPLSQPAKCVRCSGKKIKYAYHILCADCVSETGHCAKCNKIEEVVNPPEASVSEAARLEAEFQRELKLLPERKRRTFLRYLRNQEKKATGGHKEGEATEIVEPVPTLAEIREEARKQLKDLTEKFSLEDDFDDLLDLDGDFSEDEFDSED